MMPIQPQGPVAPTPGPIPPGPTQPGPGPTPGMNVPGAPPVAGPLAPGVSGEDMAAAAKSDFDRISFKNGRLDEKMAKDKADLSSLKSRVTMELYRALQDAGVDMGDVESVSAFVQQVEQEDPDLLELLDAAFRVIAPEGLGPMGGPPAGPEGPPGVPPAGPDVADRFRGLRGMMAGQSE